MDSLSQFSVLLVIFGVYISSVLSDVCYDNDDPNYTYTCGGNGKCCYGNCCWEGTYCCGSGSCCSYTQPTNELPNSAMIGIVVGSVILALALIAGIIALCCFCFRTSKTGHVLPSPPQYAQQPYDVNSQYDQMAQQSYPTTPQVQYPTVPRVQQQPAVYIPPADYEQRRQRDRPRRHHSVPYGQY